MRYSKDHKAQTRARIVHKAAVRLREDGLNGVAIADLMKQAGLTHGGFYAHFRSRDALIGEAMIFAMDGITQRWRKRAELAPKGKKFDAIVNGYLTARHRDDTGNGCVLPALGAEIARADAKIRKAFAARLEDMIALIIESRGVRPTKAARAQATGAICAMIGALVLARATSGTLSSNILDAGREAALSPKSEQKSGAGARRKSGPVKPPGKAIVPRRTRARARAG
jgi:TetR/AcrR family transcriptional repressor of nem operon